MLIISKNAVLSFVMFNLFMAGDHCLYLAFGTLAGRQNEQKRPSLFSLDKKRSVARADKKPSIVVIAGQSQFEGRGKQTGRYRNHFVNLPVGAGKSVERESVAAQTEYSFD